MLLLFSTLFILSTRTRSILHLVACGIHGTGNVSNVYGCRHMTGIVGGTHPSVITVRRLSDVATQDGQASILGRLTRHARLRPYFTPTVSCSKKGCNVNVLSGRAPLHIRAFTLPKHRRTHALLITRFPRCIFTYARLSLARRSQVGSLRVLGSIATGAQGPFFLTNSFGSSTSSNFVGSLGDAFRVLSGPGRPACPTSRPGRALSCLVTLGRRAPAFIIGSTQIVSRPLTSSRHPLLMRMQVTMPRGQVYHAGPCLRGPMKNKVAIV